MTHPGDEPRLGALGRASRSMSAEADPLQAVAILVSALQENLEVDRVGVFRLEYHGPRRRVLNRLFGIDGAGAPETGAEFIPVQDVRTPLMDVVRRKRPWFFSNNAPAEYPRHQFAEGLAALAVMPVLAGEVMIGALCVDNLPTRRSFAPEIQEPLFLYAGLVALPLFALHQREESAREAALRRQVHRDVLQAVTGGKIRLCEPGEIDRGWPDAAPVIPLEVEADIAGVRSAVRATAAGAGMPDERAADLALCASEAATNALLHGNGGWASVAADEHGVRVRITDRGRGIDPDHISHAALIRGWSSRASLGLGFTVIKQTADRLYLSTGVDGTTVVIEMETQAAAPEGSLAAWSHLTL